MKSRVARAVVLLCASFSVAQNPGAETAKPLSPLEQTLLANDNAMADAYKKKDVDFLKRTVTDNFVAIGTDGSKSGKADLLENMRESRVDEYRPYASSVILVDENAAIVTFDCVVRMMVYDETLPRYQHISNLWVKEGGQWRLRFQQATTAQ